MLKYLKTKTVPKKKTKYKYLKYSIFGFIWAVIVPIFVFLIQVAPVLNSKLVYYIFHNGFIIYFIYPVLSLLIVFGGPIGIIILVVALFQKLQRNLMRIVGIILLVNFIGWYAAGQMAQKIRNETILRVAQIAQPLMTALETYRAEQGKYPNSLLDLIPRYIDQIPQTGMQGYPKFEYEKFEFVSGLMKKPANNETENKWFRFNTGGYELHILPPLGSSNFDRFVYWPNKKYPLYMYSGYVDRIGDWSYTHE